VAAQTTGSTPDAAATACVGAGGQAALCGAAAAAGLAAQGHMALLAGLGSEIGGTATTLGTRVQGGPRLTFSGRLAAVDASLPDLSDPAGAGERGGFVPAVHAEMALGLFEGLRLMPTVGGFLSLDAFGRAAFLLLPESQGYSGGATAISAGIRVGVFREGFTIPGVSASISRRFIGSVDVGATADPASVSLDPGVTSIRATVGKDLFAVEWLAGFGWDDFGGDVVLRAADGVGGTASAAGSIDASRRLWFASASMTFSIVLNLALEAGWAEGFDPIAAYSGAYDPTSGALFGAVSARLIL
jgi:hypothetical protein